MFGLGEGSYLASDDLDLGPNPRLESEHRMEIPYPDLVRGELNPSREAAAAAGVATIVVVPNNPK